MIEGDTEGEILNFMHQQYNGITESYTASAVAIVVRAVVSKEVVAISYITRDANLQPFPLSSLVLAGFSSKVELLPLLVTRNSD